MKLRSGLFKFKNYCKQLAVLFNIYADFECNVKGVRSSDRNNNTSYTEKYQAHIPCSFVYKVVCVDEKFSKSCSIQGKNGSINSLKQFLKIMISATK